jgi:hypothetical protein
MTDKTLPGHQYAIVASLLALLLFWVNIVSASNNLQWKLYKEDKGNALYTRKVENSPFLEVKAITQINAPQERVLAALGDGDSCTNWQKVCKSSRVFEKISEKEFFIYTVLDLPWPLSDRDLVIRSISESTADDSTITIKLLPATDNFPKGKYVRAESNGSYVIKKINDKRTEFTWIMHTNIGGKISPKVINPQLVSNTLKDLKRLVKEVEK